VKVSTVEEMRELDRRAIHDHRIPDHILMENAGEAVYFLITREVGVEGNRFVVLCGVGNNGGDGLVVARKLHSSGGRVRVFVLGEVERYGASSSLHLEMLKGCGVEVEQKPSIESLSSALAEADVVVDGLFGTGIDREVGGGYREAIEAVNRCEAVVVAIDIPSGVDGDTGRVRGVAVEADFTVTFGLPKRGNLLYPGAEMGGCLAVTYISFPQQLSQAPHISVALEMPLPIPPRPADGHKGTFGDVLTIAGAASYFGAPVFAALSVLKAGAGYSRLAAPASVVPSLAALAPEVVFVSQTETPSGSLALAAEDSLLALSEKVAVVILGPGLSLDGQTRELVRRLVERIPRPLVVDGDGLTAVAEDPDVIRKRKHPTVLTPHVGEMARLTGMAKAEVAADPIGLLRACVTDLEAIVVLKGARSLVGLPDGRVFVNPSGNSGLATAGSGDVLTGTIAAAYGLGLELEPAVRAGVFLHGLAGDLAAEDVGEDGMTARDVLESLPQAVRLFRQEYDDLAKGVYGTLEVI